MASLEAILVPPIPTTRVNQITILGCGADTATAIAAHGRTAALGLALILLKRQHRGSLASELAVLVGHIRHTGTVTLGIRRQVRRHVDTVVATDGLRCKAILHIVHEGLRLHLSNSTQHRRSKRLMHRSGVRPNAELRTLLERTTTPLETSIRRNIVHTLLANAAANHLGRKALTCALGPVGHSHQHGHIG